MVNGIREIIVVDDDVSIRELICHSLDGFAMDKYKINQFSDPTTTLEYLAHEKPNVALLITDLMMPKINGYELILRFREIYKDVPVIICSVKTNDYRNIIKMTELNNTIYLNKPFDPDKLQEIVGDVINGFSKSTYACCFIVHGHDSKSLGDLKDVLANDFKIYDPIILNDFPSYGMTIIEKLESCSNNMVDIVFVLMTADDHLFYRDGSIANRCRQNVVLELGYFIGKFGRKSGKIIILYDKKVELPSDIEGIVYVDIGDGIQSAKDKIYGEIKHILTHKNSLGVMPDGAG